MEKTVTLKKPYDIEELNKAIDEMYEALNLIVSKIVETEEYTIVYFVENYES